MKIMALIITKHLERISIKSVYKCGKQITLNVFCIHKMNKPCVNDVSGDHYFPKEAAEIDSGMAHPIGITVLLKKCSNGHFMVN